MPHKEKESRIPVGTQFTPDLIDLKNFLAALIANSGNKNLMADAVWVYPKVRISKPKKTPTGRQKSLPLEAAVQYGLLEPTSYKVTKLTQELAPLPVSEIYEKFASHILLNKGGLRILEGIEQMEADGLKVIADDLCDFLTSQGFRVTTHNTAINSLRKWLAEAGIFPKGRNNAWRIDHDVKEDILGLSGDMIFGLTGLNKNQRAFLEGLCALNPSGWHPASDIRDWAETIRGVKIGRASLPKEILTDLEKIGIIKYKSGGTSGGKTSILKTTKHFKKDVLEQFVANTIKDLDAAISAYYKMRPIDIYKDLNSKDVYKKGIALEAYTIYIMRLMGLRFVSWRKRAEAEVDALLTGLIGGLPTRWQVQCKNTPSATVRIEDVAKEVGLAPLTNSTHILFIANSYFSNDAKSYAIEVMKNSSLFVFLIDKDEFEKIKQNPGQISSILRAKSERILKQSSNNYFTDDDF